VEFLLESWRYRELIYFFAWRDVKVRYKQAALGAAWAIFQPLLGMAVFTVVFGRLANVPSDGVPYPVFAYAGLMLWTYFSSVLTQSGHSLVSNANLLTKVYFPRVALPFSTAAAGLLDLGISAAFVIPLMIYFQVTPSWAILLAPLYLVLLVAFTTALGLVIAAVNVSYRDIKYVLPLIIQLGLFITPVLYPASYVPEKFQTLLALNPLTGVMEGFRSCLLLGELPDLRLTAISVVSTVALLAFGLAYFRRVERDFADIV
jgi:lipopolysaccharide transport system permease protein